MRKSLLAGALILYVACSGGGGDGSGPGPVASVTVTIAASTIAVNATTQATAVAKDANGTVVSGKTAAWTSLTPAVASVSSTTGVITCVAAGNATIQATIDGVSGTGAVSVPA